MMRRAQPIPLPVFHKLMLGVLALCAIAVVQAPMAAVSSDGRWALTRSADPLNSGRIVMASFTGGEVDALVRCWSRTGELDLRFMLAPGNGRAVSNNVKLGFDSHSAFERSWRLSPSGLALVVPGKQRESVLRGLQRSNHLSITVTTEESEVTHGIPLNGSARAIRTVLGACKR